MSNSFWMFNQLFTQYTKTTLSKKDIEKEFLNIKDHMLSHIMENQ